VTPLLYLIIGIIAGGALAAIIVLLARRGQDAEGTLLTKIELLERAQERGERIVREEMGRGRDESARAARTQREELRAALMSFTETFATQTGKLTESNEHRLESLRAVVDLRLKQLQDDNSKQLDKMRTTVDEKLQGTLERRLGESFKLVSERLEQVHQGLGAMQQLASDVGGLQKVLTNVKARGGWGEVQLGSLLEQLLTPDQFARNVKTREESGEQVEFAIKLPGDENGAPVWLPIDAKFPTENYHRLVAAQEKGDLVAVDGAMKSLEMQLKRSAKDICQKYINPPQTTDFALMFLPTEGLYAEAIRRVGLVEQVQRDCRVVFAGPTTLAALLNSLQMGFRTLAIQKRSSEVWNLLAAVKTEFGKFGESLSAVKDKLDQAARHVDTVAVRSRAITKKLRDVEELPSNPPPVFKNLLGAPDNEGDVE
jgi:DNA recombination protein RmuC